MKWIAALLLFTFAIKLAFADNDAVEKYDDAIISAQVMDECHLDIQGSLSNEKMDATGQAAFHQLWASLDTQDPSQHDQNGERADFMLKKHTEADLVKGHQQVTDKGCAALADHTRDVLVFYRQ